MDFTFNETNTFCISLYSNSDRWTKMEKRFQLLNLNVSRFRTVSNLQELNDNFAPSLSNTEKFCSQSHINIWKHIVQNKIPVTLILEDDACFDKNWREKLNMFNKEINDDHLDAILLNASDSLDVINKWSIANEQYLTAGYILTLKGATNLLNSFKDCFYSSDWMLSRLQKNGHSYTFFPWLIIQEGKDSMLRINYDADHEKVLKCLNKISYSLSNYII